MLDGMFNNLQDIYYRTDTNCDIVWISDSAKVMLGYDSVDALIGQNLVVDLCADRIKMTNSLDMLNENGKVTDYEVPLITKDGSTITVDAESYLYQNDNGEVAGVEGVFRDITERRAVERALRESEEKYRLIVQNVDEIIYMIDIENDPLHGKVGFVSDRVEQILGYSPAEFMSDPGLWFDILHPDDVPLVVETTQRISLNKEDIVRSYRLRHKRSGEYLYLEDKVVPKMDREGNVTGLFGVARDITERKRTEKSVMNIAKGVSAKTGDEFFYSLAEHLTDTLKSDCVCIAEVQPAGSVVQTLALMADGRLIENRKMALEGTPCEIVAEKNIATFQSGVQSLFPEARIMTEMNIEGYVGTKLIDSFGKHLGHMSVMYHEPIKNASMVESILRIFAARAAAEIERRQSEEKLKSAKEEIAAWNRELEERVKDKTDKLVQSQAQLVQSEKLSVMGQMAAGLAHELNSPLAGLLPLLKKHKEMADKDSPGYRELNIMYRASEHMAKVIRDFGTFSRAPGQAHETLCVNSVIDDTLSFSCGKLKQNRIAIIKEYADNLPDVMGDRTGLQQVVLNIITNARDAMFDGGTFTIITSASLDKRHVLIFARLVDGLECKRNSLPPISMLDDE